MEPAIKPFELTLTELAGGGDAVGRRSDGLVVFVPGGAPGDVVAAQLIDAQGARRGYARARLVRIEVAGAERTPPACALASPDQCGGCPLMHVSRTAQLAAKRTWVERALRHTQAVVLPPLAPTPDLGYRVRARLVVSGGRLGFAGARSHRRVAVSRCAVLHPRLDRVLLQDLQPLAGFLGEGAEVRGLCLGEPAEVQLAITTGRGAQRKKVRDTLLALVRDQAIRGVFLDDELLGEADLGLGAGAAELGELRLDAAGFAQASAAGHDVLPRLTAAAVLAPSEADAATGPRPRWPRLLELYAGSGNLTRALRACADSLVCIESDPRAAARLRGLAAAWSQPQPTVQVIAEPVERALSACVRSGERAPVIVLDPPRTGAREALPDVVALRPERIVYVSCDPMTLGRDLVELERAGFVTRTVQPIDLMPHTAEIECVALLDAARPS